VSRFRYNPALAETDQTTAEGTRKMKTPYLCAALLALGVAGCESKVSTTPLPPAAAKVEPAKPAEAPTAAPASSTISTTVTTAPGSSTTTTTPSGTTTTTSGPSTTTTTETKK
jgi:hypothetical protein